LARTSNCSPGAWPDANRVSRVAEAFWVGSRVALNRGFAESGPGPMGMSESCPRGGTTANASGDLAVAPVGRHRTSEVVMPGWAPSAEGRRGSVANESRHVRVSRAAPDIIHQSCQGEKPWHSRKGIDSANCASRPRKPKPNGECQRRVRARTGRWGSRRPKMPAERGRPGPLS